MAVTVLLVEPEEALRQHVRDALKGEGHTLLAFATAQGALRSLGELHPTLAILSSTTLDPHMDDLVRHLGKQEVKCQTVWVVAPGGEAEALTLERHPRGLVTRPDLAREAVFLANQIEARRERAQSLVDVPELIGGSSVIEELRSLLERVAQGGAPTVLITGESGTGKEVAARNLHALGSRNDQPFVEIDCASVPTELLESTLFGHEAGAFTDAKVAKRGLLELAQGGTVFLDEIGEIDLGLQAKLLRVLDTRRFRPVGSTREVHLDVHWIAATNRDLEHEVQEKQFRADLFYRLDVVRVAVPPLRARGEDILLLAERFLEEAARRLGVQPVALEADLKQELLSYSWPGNVRELKNHAERLTLAAVQPAPTPLIPLRSDRSHSRVFVDFSHGPVEWTTVEREILLEAMEASGGNVSEAARLLGLGRGAMRYRLSRHNLFGEDSQAA